MRNSIRKIASLCLAMAMILATLAMPAFAEERAVHIHSYDIELSHDEEYDVINDHYHCLLVTRSMACSCGESTIVFESGPRQPHIFVSYGDTTGGNTEGDTDNYFICTVCDHVVHN